jgi:hypothetical protein
MQYTKNTYTLKKQYTTHKMKNIIIQNYKHNAHEIRTFRSCTENLLEIQIGMFRFPNPTLRLERLHRYYVLGSVSMW